MTGSVIARVCIYTLAGAVLGFLVALMIVVVFVDNDMVLMYYVAGMVGGTVVGAIAGILSGRKARREASRATGIR